MCLMAPLSDEEIERGLAGLPGWRRDGDMLVRDYELPAFMGVIEAVREIAELAEAADHHPDLDIRYRKLRVALTTHDEGGITQRDLDLAGKIETAASRWG
jgi:4a-hydroxytetrahydrobiopterin dehydratase